MQIFAVIKNCLKELTFPVKPHTFGHLIQALDTQLCKLRAPFQVEFQLFYYNKYTYVCTFSGTAVCMYKCPIVTCMYIQHCLWRVPGQKQAHCEQVLAQKTGHSDSIGLHGSHHGPMRWGQSCSLAAELPLRIRTVLSSGAWGTVPIQFHLQPEWRVRLTCKAGLASLHTTSGDLRIHLTFRESELIK